jgi:hypothetical protein
MTLAATRPVAVRVLSWTEEAFRRLSAVIMMTTAADVWLSSRRSSGISTIMPTNAARAAARGASVAGGGGASPAAPGKTAYISQETSTATSMASTARRANSDARPSDCLASRGVAQIATSRKNQNAPPLRAWPYRAP